MNSSSPVLDKPVDPGLDEGVFEMLPTVEQDAQVVGGDTF
jgi:hypothetical protein